MRNWILIFMLLTRSLVSFGYNVTVCVQFIGPSSGVSIPLIHSYSQAGSSYADTAYVNPQSYPAGFCFQTFLVLPDSGNFANISGSIFSPNCNIMPYYLSTAQDTAVTISYFTCQSGCPASISIGGSTFNELTGISAGVPPFQYQWNSGSAISPMITVNTTFNYCVVITDSTGCVDTACVFWYAPPINDECSGAISLSSGAACSPLGATTMGATASTSTSVTACQGFPDDDVWFSFVASGSTQLITATATSSIDIVIELLSGSCSSLSSMACIDQTFQGGQENLQASGLTPGQTYFIRVYGFFLASNNSTMGSFDICVQDIPACSTSVQINSIQSDELVVSSTGVPPFTYLWSDGSTNPSLLINTPGNYCVMVTDANGCADSACIFANPLICEAYIIHGIDSAGTIFLTAEPDSAAGAVLGYSWSNGDTAQSVVPNMPGNYCVTITYSSGCVSSTCYYFNPSPGNGCSVFASAVQDSANPSMISFFAYPLGTPPFTFSWLFSDGDTANTQFPVHQFPVVYSGIWAFVTSTDATGCQSYFSFFPNPLPPSNSCSASFTNFANYQFGNQGEIFFFDQSLGQGNASPVSFQWDFNDGSSSSQQNPSHVFTLSGIYDVCLTVSFANGCSGSFCNSVYVDLSWWTTAPPFNGNCIADFEVAGGMPGFMNLLNLSQGSHLLYSWTLSNGFVSNLQNPFIIIGAPGSYELCLQIVDTMLSCSDQFCDSVFVDTAGNIYRSNFSENASIRVISPPQPNSLLGNETHAAKASLRISPNPGSGVLYLDNPVEEDLNIEIQDISGKLIRTLRMKPGDRQIDVRGLSQGMYVFRLLWADHVQNCKQMIHD